MSGNGTVTTARGDLLNLDDLIVQSKRPIGFKDAKSEIAPKAPIKKTSLNVRGHMPSAPTTVVPQLTEEVSKFVAKKIHQKDPVSSVTNGKPVQSLSELTAVRVERARGIKVRPGATVKPGDGAAMAENEVLSGIMGALDQVAPRASKAADAYEKRREKLRRRKQAGTMTEEESLALEAEDE